MSGDDKRAQERDLQEMRELVGMRGFGIAVIIALISAMTAPPPARAQAEERWFCVPTMSTGFRFDDQTKDWVRVSFKTDDKYILAKNSSGYNAGKYVFTEVGKDYGTACLPKSEYGIFDCNDALYNITINTNSRRYLQTYHAGYVSGQDNNDNTPFIEIGVCSPL